MRERLAGRFGFLMLAAGSAVGLGNVWRFPYVAGVNGGAAFVVVYLVFLVVLGFPLLAAEIGIGRGAGRSLSAALGMLAPPDLSRFWSRVGAVLASGCFVLMIYYTDVAGWILKYTSDYCTGRMPGDPAEAFSSLSADWRTCGVFMVLAVVISSVVCLAGVVKGVERTTKFMMVSLLAILGTLAARSAMLPGAEDGLAFFLRPDWAKFMAHPWQSVSDAMGQAFFTLSLGIGSMTICGSYVGKDHSLVKETAIIIVIDTMVAILAGLAIFPACSAYGIAYTEGPGLVFVALPKVFSQMPGGAFWGFLFFLFLSFAALTTVIAVFECLIGGLMDSLGVCRRVATIVTGIGVALLSMPCVLSAKVLQWEDFAVSQVWLPVGALLQGFFVVNGRFGWGWERFRASVSEGRGVSMPGWMRVHYAYVIPVLVLVLLACGIARAVM